MTVRMRKLPHVTCPSGMLVVAFFLPRIFTPRASVLASLCTNVSPEVRPVDAIVILDAGGRRLAGS